MGHFARVCHSNTDNTRKRINHIEEIGEAYNDEEEQSEPEEIRQITQISRRFPDKIDHYEIQVKITGEH